LAEEERLSSWDSRKNNIKEEMEELSVKYQIMSKYTSYLCINKNEGEDGKPTEEIKEVEIIKAKPKVK
jgi:hypothetical protein